MIARSLRTLESRLKLRRCSVVGVGCEAWGKVWIWGGGRIVLGDRVILDGSLAPIELHAAPGSEIVLGDDVHVEGGVSIEAQRSIVVGARSHIGSFAKLLDNHFHRVVGDRHERPPSTPVLVGADVRIEARAIVLPGGVLGEHATVREGAVITRRFPDGAVVAGVPASVVRAPR